MPNQKTDKQDYSTINPDEERDMAAKGGPTTSLGNADDAHDVSHSYDEDTQTKSAAYSTEKKKSGETLNDDWKTGSDKNMNEDKSSKNPGNDSMNQRKGSDMNRNASNDMYRNSSNYKTDSGESISSNTGSMNQKRSDDMDEE